MKITYRYNLEIRKKSFKKGNESEGKVKHDKSKVIWFYCKKDGHFKKDNYKRQQDKEKKKDKKINQVGVTNSTVLMIRIFSMSYLPQIMVKIIRFWILDAYFTCVQIKSGYMIIKSQSFTSKLKFVFSND